MLKKVNDSKLCISNDLLFKTIAIAVICILFQIEVYSQKIVVRKYKSFRPDSIKGMHGLFYRLPSTRFKVVISGKHIVEKPSKLLKDSLYLQQVLAYPIPFVRKERNENVVESVELIPETVPDRENLFFVEMKSSGVFKNINFSFKSDDQLIPFSSEYSAEGNPITLLVKVADVTIDLLVPGVSPSFSKIERTQAPQFFLGYEDESIPQKAKKVVEEAHVPQISDYVKKDNELSEDIAKVFYEFVEQAPSVSDKEKELPGPALDKELKKLIAPEYSVSDKSITDFSNELIKKWNEGTLG
ncbi:MAG TPA: hypothetical protein PK325_03060, partial [Cyclobacteriaceae bacterium]|nr:hypothetical protein [Cyclobacteriaceae bacterium]